MANDGDGQCYSFFGLHFFLAMCWVKCFENLKLFLALPHTGQFVSASNFALASRRACSSRAASCKAVRSAGLHAWATGTRLRGPDCKSPRPLLAIRYLIDAGIVVPARVCAMCWFADDPGSKCTVALPLAWQPPTRWQQRIRCAVQLATVARSCQPGWTTG